MCTHMFMGSLPPNSTAIRIFHGVPSYSACPRRTGTREVQVPINDSCLAVVRRWTSCILWTWVSSLVKCAMNLFWSIVVRPYLPRAKYTVDGRGLESTGSDYLTHPLSEKQNFPVFPAGSWKQNHWLHTLRRASSSQESQAWGLLSDVFSSRDDAHFLLWHCASRKAATQPR